MRVNTKIITTNIFAKRQHVFVFLLLIVISIAGILLGQTFNSGSQRNTVLGFTASECQVHDHSSYLAVVKSTRYSAFVKHIQQDLLILGYDVSQQSVDGYYNTETVEAIAMFKVDNGLSGNGESFSVSDWAALGTEINTYLTSTPECAPPDGIPKINPSLPTNPTVVICKNNLLFVKLGDNNQCVKTVQTFLKFAIDGRKGYDKLCPTFAPVLKPPLQQTRVFNPQTRRYVKCFQEWQGINPKTGQATAYTYRLMNRVCKLNSSYTGIPTGDTTVKSFKNYWFCNPNAKSVYLTFDDGPQLTATTQVLDVLEQKGVKVTFYVAGYRADIWYGPAIVKDEFARGHSIQNHTYGHKNLINLSSADVRKEIDNTAKAIHKYIGVWPTCVRPPYGSTSTRVSDIIENEFGSEVIIWTKNSADYSHKSSSGILRASKTWGAGDDVLGHDTYGYLWAPVLGQIIDTLRDKGLEFDGMCSNPTQKPY